MPSASRPVGGGASEAGSSGVISATTLVSGGWAGNAPAGKLRMTWPSPLEPELMAEPVGPRLTSIVLGLGGSLPATNSFGGCTHREGGGGANPSKSGRDRPGPAIAVKTATPAYRIAGKPGSSA